MPADRHRPNAHESCVLTRLEAVVPTLQDPHGVLLFARAAKNLLPELRDLVLTEKRASERLLGLASKVYTTIAEALQHLELGDLVNWNELAEGYFGAVVALIERLDAHAATLPRPRASRADMPVVDLERTTLHG